MSLERALKKVLVIGDRLKDFSINEKAITISELEKLIDSQSVKKSPIKYIISIGQGIAEERLKSLCNKISNSNLVDTFKLKNPSFKKSNTHLTHKKMSKNIMISEPSRINENVFTSFLMIDDAADEMNDHLTGQHIQGMVLIEAARQMVIAVTKKYLISEADIKSISFVTRNTNAIFHEFVFPIPITIRYEILEMRRIINSNLTSKAQISFIQNDEVAVEIFFTYSVLNSDFVKEKESYSAQKNVKAYFENEQLSQDLNLRIIE